MKKLIIVAAIILFAGVIIGQSTIKPEIDPEIVGRWDYLKTLNEDGNEKYSMISMEHYYADGKVMFITMRVTPYALDKVPKTHEELVSALKKYDSGLGIFETNKKNNSLRITRVAGDNRKNLGNAFRVKYKIIGDTLIFDNTYYFIREKR